MQSYILYSLVKRQNEPPPTPFPHECLYKKKRSSTPGYAAET
jgi:hypothetical protein